MPLSRRGREKGEPLRRGTPDEVREKLEPLWETADSVCYVPPSYGLGPDKLLAYGAAIAQMFYG